MPTPPLLTTLANTHIALAVVGMASFAQALPGGIHRNVGPEGISYPFAVMTYVRGSDSLALGADNPSGGLVYQLKVVDIGNDESRAATAYSYVRAALVGANNSNASGASVSGQETSPFDLPVTEGDQLFQQIGGVWSFWVDPN